MPVEQPLTSSKVSPLRLQRTSVVPLLLGIVAAACTDATAPASDPTPSASTTTTVSANRHFVSPTGTSSGDGTAAKPWDLRTALSHPSRVRPGDTIYVRGGTYRGIYTSTLAGTSTAPIVVRAYAKERATIDATGGTGTILKVNGPYAVFWGLEVMDSRRTSTTQRGGGVELYGRGTKLVNSVVHDATGNGVGFWSSAIDGEVYGSIVYNNGYQTNRGSGHGIYSQNRDGVKRIVDNVVFNSYGFGLHIYGSSNASFIGYHIEGNVFLNAGAISSGGAETNVLIGGGSPANNITFTRNVVYRSPTLSNIAVRLGYQASPVWNENVTFTNNVLFDRGQSLVMTNWRRATVSSNTLAGYLLSTTSAPDLSVTRGYGWSGNTQVASSTAQAWSHGGTRYTWSNWKTKSGLGSTDRLVSSMSTPNVIVRPNRYEAGRANIVVVNWSGAGSVSADVSGVLRVGDAYEVRDAHNFYGPAVATGTYGGGSISLSLASRTPAAPIGGASRAPIATQKHLATFVLLRR